LHQQEDAFFALEAQLTQARRTRSNLIAHFSIGEAAYIVNEGRLVFAAVVGSDQKLREVELRGWG
jgi:hypothetical protein